MKQRLRRYSVFILVAVFSIGLGASIGLVSAYLASAPSLDQVNIRQEFTTHIYDINGDLITSLFRLNRIPVAIEQVPEHLKNAIVAIEDESFYEHHGINFRRVIGAAIANIRERRTAQGASTITMQLARNVFLTQEKLFTRKLEEVLWAIQIERKYSKAEILEAYLNEIYLNHGAYGVQAAALTYFNKSVDELTLSESALLAGIIRWPARYSPFVNYDVALQRRNFVLARMQEQGYISAEEAEAARAEPIALVERQGRVLHAPYFVDYILADLIERYGEETVFAGGLRVHTTLDLQMQKDAERALLQGLPVGGTTSGGLTQPQGALIALDPQSGHIRAMVGGRGEDKFNRAVQALRPPGSAIKIFAFTAAIDRGFTAATVYVDEPSTFRIAGGQEWSPQNYSEEFLGPLTLREALERSTNIIAVKLVEELGARTVVDYAKAMGITTLVESGRTNDMGLSPLSLGGLTRGVSPLEMASAYGVLANQGIRTEPMSIVKITDAFGNVLEQNSPTSHAVLDEQVSYLMTDMLRGVIERGTGRNASIGRPAAGKTGTHQNYRDAWFVGYTPDLATAVWFGADTPERMVYNGVRYGSWNAARIWADFMSSALADTPTRDFSMPPGFTTGVAIDTKTGLLVAQDCTLPGEEVRREIFINNTVPTEYSHRCQPQDIDLSRPFF